MAGWLRAIAKLISFGLALLFIALAPFSLFLHDASRILFTPDAISSVVSDHLIESGAVHSLLLDLLVEEPAAVDDPTGGGLKTALANLTPESRRKLAETLLPPEWIEEQVSRGVRSFYSWALGGQSTLELTIETKALKTSLLEGGLRRIVETIVLSWEPCTPSQLRQFLVAASDARPGDMPLCRPPADLEDAFLKRVTESLAGEIERMPAQFDLASGWGAGQLVDLQAWLRLTILIARWSWLIPLLALGLVMTLSIRSWRDLGSWWGMPLFMAGALALILLLLAKLSADSLLAQAMLSGAFPALLKEPFELAARDLWTRMTNLAAWHAILATGAGLLLFLLTRRSTTRTLSAFPTNPGIERPSSAPPAAAAELPPPMAPPPLAPFPPPTGAPSATSAADETPSGMFG